MGGTRRDRWVGPDGTGGWDQTGLVGGTRRDRWVGPDGTGGWDQTGPVGLPARGPCVTAAPGHKDKHSERKGTRKDKTRREDWNSTVHWPSNRWITLARTHLSQQWIWIHTLTDRTRPCDLPYRQDGKAKPQTQTTRTPVAVGSGRERGRRRDRTDQETGTCLRPTPALYAWPCIGAGSVTAAFHSVVGLKASPAAPPVRAVSVGVGRGHVSPLYNSLNIMLVRKGSETTAPFSGSLAVLCAVIGPPLTARRRLTPPTRSA